MINNSNNYCKVAEINGKLCGFIIGQTDVLNPKLCYLSLIAVSEDYSGKSIGKELFKAFIQDFGRHHELIEIGTQINNFSANKLYSKYNFKLVDNVITMHWHKS